MIHVNDVIRMPNYGPLARVEIVEDDFLIVSEPRATVGGKDRIKVKLHTLKASQAKVVIRGVEIDADAGQEKREHIPEANREYRRRYYEENRAKIRAKFRAWFEALPEEKKQDLIERRRASSRKRKAELKAEKQLAAA